jgi:hypothetical protein
LRMERLRRSLYYLVTGPRFPSIRALVWAVQIPLAIATPLKESVVYLVFLSLAALVESALTDAIEGWKFVKEDDDDGDDGA